MEGLTRIVSESLARHGFDRPLDYRRLSWSRWFRCESHHSLLFVPSKPGVFALAEEIMDISAHGAADALVRPADITTNREGHDFSRAVNPEKNSPALAAEGPADGGSRPGSPRRMLAVTQFFEDDDMAFVLDRMLSRQNPMAARLASGRYFARYVVIEDQTQRRSICNALNQWMVSAAEKATGIGSHFATSLELTPATEYVPQANEAQPSLFDAPNVGRTLLSATADTTATHVATAASAVPRSEPGFSASHSSLTAPQLDSGAATNIHCPSPFPSGF
jgi:hypothetical protein